MPQHRGLRRRGGARRVESSAMASGSNGSGPGSPSFAGSVIASHSAGLIRAWPTSPASSRISSSMITSDDGCAARSSWSWSCAEAVVHRHQRHLGLRRREQRDRELGPVRRHVHEVLDAELTQHGRPRRARACELGVGDATGAGTERHPVVEAGGGHVEEQRQVHRLACSLSGLPVSGRIGVGARERACRRSGRRSRGWSRPGGRPRARSPAGTCSRRRADDRQLAGAAVGLEVGAASEADVARPAQHDRGASASSGSRVRVGPLHEPAPPRTPTRTAPGATQS